MNGIIVSADGHGNVEVHVTVTTVAGVVAVEQMGGVTVLELGADQHAQLRLYGPADVLAAVAAHAVHQLRPLGSRRAGICRRGVRR